MGNREEIGRNIRKWRLNRNMTQAQLAEYIGKGESTVAMYEAGRREPDMDTIEAIADILNVRMIDLIPIVSAEPWDPAQMGWADRQDEKTYVMARGWSNMNSDQRQQLLDVARVMFGKDFDMEGNKKR